MDIMKSVVVFFMVTQCVQCVEMPKFPYPCYVDVCTFPDQFCNSRERRCSPCTRAVCALGERSVPLACRYICTQNNQPQTTTTTTATVKSSPATISGDKCESMHVLMIYSSVSVTVILSVAMGSLAFYCHRRKFSFSRPPSLLADEVNIQEKDLMVKNFIQQQNLLRASEDSHMKNINTRQTPVTKVPRRYADSGIQAVTADLNNLSATSSSGNGVVICSPVDETNAVQYFVTAEPSMTMLRQENKNVCPTEEATTFLEEDEGLLQQYRSLMARHDSSLEEVTSTISL
ncbi:uncharacterized protein LOC128213207 [Mya arenaria]|uniref:uncharacterized protein LOC128213207 n=1 Tax=Mya arenaria TaxID=6604 RepID=UPI0022E81AC0|nr:uncharacterized protein LOC128213207 [Mya arenaria]